MGTKTLQSLLDAIGRALEMERTQPEAAVLALRGVLSEALRCGVESAYLRYVLAQALERKGELEMAFDEIKKAMKLDPLALPIRHAFQSWRAGSGPRWTTRRGRSTTRRCRGFTRCCSRPEGRTSRHIWAMVRFELATGELGRHGSG